MFVLIIIAFVIAAAAALFGQTDFAIGAVNIARILFYLFLASFILKLVLGEILNIKNKQQDP